MGLGQVGAAEVLEEQRGECGGVWGRWGLQRVLLRSESTGEAQVCHLGA